MSGFLAMLDLAGDRVDEELLARLTARMAYRGPDASSTHAGAGFGFGHTLARTGEPAHDAFQPLVSAATGCVFAGDVRVDDRDRYLRELGGGDDRQPANADAALILAGYERWGADVVDHLLGDFAFAIWDPRARQLFCARDHIGVKPLYFAIGEATVLVSNSVRCLRGHPMVSDRLDEHAVADYLIFGFNRHAERSAFADLRRLAPATTLTIGVEDPHPHLRRYWRLPVRDTLRLSRDEEYVERLDSLLAEAVGDRVRGPAGVLMSGGLDSTSVAATAAKLMRTRGAAGGLDAFTYYYADLIADEEADYAALAASALNIPLHRVRLDEDRAVDFWRTANPATPEPMSVPMTGRMARYFEEAGGGIRVGLTGEGGDPASQLLPGDALRHVSRHPIAGVLASLRYRRRRGRLPRLGLRTAVRRRLGRGTAARPVYPPWLPPSMERRLELRHRFEALNARDGEARAIRPASHSDLGSPEWSLILEGYDPGYTKFAADIRHPWLDVRVLDFMLRLPPIPWCVDKEIVRRTMGTTLPPEIVERPKAPLAGYPLFDATLDGLADVLDIASATPSLAEFIDIGRFLGIAGKPERLRPSEYEVITRPLGLALWLRQLNATTET